MVNQVLERLNQGHSNFEIEKEVDLAIINVKGWKRQDRITVVARKRR